jgi:adenylosuccinate synthase
VNGVTQLAMMKSDVLSGFDSVPVCHSYQYEGAPTQNLPYGIEPDEVTADYKNHPGWQEDLTSTTTEAALPDSLKEYIAMVEQEMETPITIVSVGPDRAQTIER